jgi:ketopantoate reductase
MRVAVMAAGAVGGYFGGRVAAAGHDVAFIARGDFHGRYVSEPFPFFSVGEFFAAGFKEDWGR